MILSLKPKNPTIRSLATLAIACIAMLTYIVGSSVAHADIIDLGTAGLDDPASVITFSEVEIGDTEQVTDQFAGLGVTFVPNMNYRTGDNPDWQNVEGPNLRNGEPEVNPFTIKFVDPQTAAAFNAIAQPPTPTTITAKLNGAVVESFETTVSIDNPNNFFGFTGIEFDEIEVEYTAETRMRIDNLQFGQPAPTTIIDFSESDGGFTVTNEAHDNPWVYNAGPETWSTDGSANGAPNAHTRLTSPELTIDADGDYRVTMDHRYDIEGDNWDAGALFTSINGGPFTVVPNSEFTENGYTQLALRGEHALTGGEGWGGISAGHAAGTFITSVAGPIALSAGDTIQLQLLMANDQGTAGTATPNWEIDSVGIELIADTDGDGMTDIYELDNGLDPNDPADADTDLDSDGASNFDEFVNGTDPNDNDSDDDGLLDGVESNTGIFVGTGDTGTDPLNADSDGEGLSDGDEVNTHETDPLDADSDGDGIGDGTEVAQGTDPLDGGDVPEGIAELHTLSILPSGNYVFLAGDDAFEGYVHQEERDGEKTSWLLVGRGREGWDFDDDGQGSVEDVITGLGTPDAFSPAMYSDDLINALLDASGVDLTEVEIRISRAANPEGTAYSEVRWRPTDQATWRGNFDDPEYAVEHEVVDGAGLPDMDPGVRTDGNTKDIALSGNGGSRVFTFPWGTPEGGGHLGVQGFSYGQAVTDGANNDTSFLWETGVENHALPYTQLYIRIETEFVDPARIVAPDMPEDIAELHTLSIQPTGNYAFRVGDDAFEGYVHQEERDGEKTSWLLVGRGREGWDFDDDGQGSVEDVITGLGTPDAFSPAMYSDDLINALLDASGVDLTEVEIRISRAANPEGTAYSEVRWRPTDQATWRGNFDDPEYAVEHEVVDGAGLPDMDPGVRTDGNTKDIALSGNGGSRVFTFPWGTPEGGGHLGVQGFSYGQAVANGANDDTSFLWENADENHALPYTELYIRIETEFVDPARIVSSDADGDGILDILELDLVGNLDDISAGDDDGDGLNSPDEVLVHRTDPLLPDTDGDTLNDGDEIANSTDPNNDDTDNDGLTDAVETNTGVFVDANDTGTDPNNPDTDGGLAPDGFEVQEGTDPHDPADDPIVIVQPSFIPINNIGAAAGYEPDFDNPGLDYQENHYNGRVILANNAQNNYDVHTSGDPEPDDSQQDLVPYLDHGGGGDTISSNNLDFITGGDNFTVRVNGYIDFTLAPTGTYNIHIGADDTNLFVLDTPDGPVSGQHNCCAQNQAFSIEITAPGYYPIDNVFGEQDGGDWTDLGISGGDIVGVVALGDVDAGSPPVYSITFDQTDSEPDGMPDAYELSFAAIDNLGQLTADGDFDNDGLLDPEEFDAGTNPTEADTDGGTRSGLEGLYALLCG